MAAMASSLTWSIAHKIFMDWKVRTVVSESHANSGGCLAGSGAGARLTGVN
jgi:hypothetical protein